MKGLLRTVIAVTSVAAGSWVGLHRGPDPIAAPVRDAPKPSATELSPPPQDAVRSLTAWPQLNPEASLGRAWALAEGPHKQPGERRRLVTLTFDDGPFPETTPTVLRELARYRVHATFFVIGRYLDGEDDRAIATRRVLRDIVAGGHLVGNHTHDHVRLHAITNAKMIDQIDRGSLSIERVTGKRPILFRPPYGELDDSGRDAVKGRGLDLVLWGIEAQDMERDDPQAMYKDLVAQIDHKEGGIVLLHDIRWSSVKVLRKLLARLHDRKWDPAQPERWGYEVVDLPQYMREVAAAPPEDRPLPPPRKISDGVPAAHDDT